MRKRLWQLHSWLGLAAGLGLLVIGLSGSLLVFHEELEALFNRELVRVEPTPAGRRPLDALLADAQRQLPEHEITGWLPQWDEPRHADVLYVIRRGDQEWLVATLDPYTGRLLASPRLGTTTLTGWLLELHYAFFADHAGLLLAAVLGLLLLVLGVTGGWLYREFWKNLLTLRWRRGARILFSDLHKFVGITSVAFNLVLGFTGAYWNFTHVIGEWLAGEHEQKKIEQRLYAPTLSLDALARDAAQRLPGFRGNFLSLPSDPAAPAVTLWGAIAPHGALTSPYGSTVVYDASTGAHRSTNDLRAAGAWARIVDSFRPLHFGEFGGLPVKILWALAGLAPGMLAVTGFAIWWTRRRKTA
ncbi:PepSY-associated TM helix domain-containing protein [Oleiharenicola sp. Vm1]|uniref:PepSY-associated TM helix domain-containing protein n=1 Tax=Oleiharenicola sp. Vm1 TaxID=3398393 RepID=UPI0039F46746